ncbi:MAG: DUF5610 domain-containing protein [Mariprofundus sp.]|nr:DUF5610 domain-containing protein [Mariprofundus sp.]
MALPISGSNTINAMIFSPKEDLQEKNNIRDMQQGHVGDVSKNNIKEAHSLQGIQKTALDSSLNIGAANDPTELILQSAMEKINKMFSPYLGDGAIQKAVDSGKSMGPQATADSIISFATQLISRTEAAQVDLPQAEKTSREQLFNNVKTGFEQGFSQAKNILEAMSSFTGKAKDSVDTTYNKVQEGLSKLADLLGVNSANQTGTTPTSVKTNT